MPWPLLAAAAPFVGAALKAGGEMYANRQNKDMAHEQMQFQNNMSSTAHQREVADLKAAGLNPILSGTGGMGAASAQGASAQMENPLAGAVDSGWDIYKKQVEGASAKQQIAQSRSQTNLLDANARKAEEEVRSAKAKADMDERDAYNYGVTTVQRIQKANEDIFAVAMQRGLMGAQKANYEQMTATEKERTAKAAIDTRIAAITEKIEANAKIRSDLEAKVNSLPYAWKIELIDRITKNGPVGMTAFVVSGLIDELYEAVKKAGSSSSPSESSPQTKKWVPPDILQAPVAP